MTLEWWQFALLALAGFAGGFVDAIAGGGGLISVPALAMTGLPGAVVLGTNKLQAVCGTLLAVFRYTRAGLIDWRRLRLAVGVTFFAAAAGAWAVSRVDDVALRKIVPVLLLGVAIYMALNSAPGGQSRVRMGMTAFAVVFGCVLGFYDGFFGPGAGAFWMLACTALLGADLRSATGTTKALNLTSNAASLVMFAAGGHLRWDVGLAMIAGQLVGARLGSGLVLERGAAIIRPMVIATAVVLAVAVLLRR